MTILRFILLVLSLNPMVISGATEGTNHTDTRQLRGYDSTIWTLCGVDIAGDRDAFIERYPNPDACVEQCKSYSLLCGAATWTNYNGGTCWMKATFGDWSTATPKVGAISFFRIIPEYQIVGPTFPSNVDMPGNDIGDQRASSSNDCKGICDRNDYCFAYTWTDYNGGTCWLKKKASPYVSKPGAVSVFVARQTNPNTCFA